MTKEMKKLQTILRRAGTHARSQFTTLQRANVYEKSRYERVTTVDRYIHRMMKRELPHIFKLPVLSEENPHAWKKTNSFWVVDPIDGTTNFITRIPFFCIGIGLVQNGIISKNAVYNPLQDELFWTEIGRGAYLNSRRLRKDHQLPLHKSIVGFSYSHSKASISSVGRLSGAIRPKIGNARHTGSTLLSLAYVASGRIEAEIITGPVTPWDTIPALLLIQEVHGRLTNFKGDPYRLMKTKNLIASNGAEHNKLLSLIKRVR